jgi:putative RNA 2'-phosphotransferase
MDTAGWVDEAAALAALGWDAPLLAAVVAGNNKRRYEQARGRIRASQGHSRALPVTCEALEASWAPYTGPDSLWHTTPLDHLDAIMAEGLLPMARTHVHLAAATDSQVGKRGAGVAALLEVSAALLEASGRGLFESPNGVVLVRDVPAACIIGVSPLTQAARLLAPSWATRWPHVAVRFDTP